MVGDIQAIIKINEAESISNILHRDKLEMVQIFKYGRKIP